MNIYLNNYHFLVFDQWFTTLPEKQQEQILENTPGIEKYLGIELVSEIFDIEKGFEFKIIDEEKWNSAKKAHHFLQNL